MKNSIKPLVTLLLGMVITSGCSLTSSRPDDCDQIRITAYLPPVVADLDYKDVMGSQNQVIVQGGFQHALAIPGRGKVVTQVPASTAWPIKDNAIHRTATVYFEFDHYSIPASEWDELNKFLHEINSPKLIHLQIEGHTDSKGSREYNKTLSIQRAKSVRDYLVQHGIQAAKISIEGTGENFPLEPNNSEANRAKNRRAVISHRTGY